MTSHTLSNHTKDSASPADAALVQLLDMLGSAEGNMCSCSYTTDDVYVKPDLKPDEYVKLDEYVKPAEPYDPLAEFYPSSVRNLTDPITGLPLPSFGIKTREINFPPLPEYLVYNPDVF